MTERTVTLPHLQALLDALPLPALYKAQAKTDVYANKAARDLLQLTDDQVMVSLAEL